MSFVWYQSGIFMSAMRMEGVISYCTVARIPARSSRAPIYCDVSGGE